MDERFDRRFDTLESRVDGLTAEVRDLKRDVGSLKVDVVDLRRHMGVLHEDALSRIQGMSETLEASVNARMDRRFDELRDLFLNHAIPGEVADRHFAQQLADQERRISSLEESS